MLEERRLAAARAIFEELAPLSSAPLDVRLWDGSVVPLSESERVGDAASRHARLEIAVADAGVLAALVRRPSLATLLAHYTSGRIDLHGGDLLDLVAALRARPTGSLRSVSKVRILRQLWPFLLTPPRTAEIPDAFGDGTRGPDRASRRHEREIQFHYDLGNDFYRLFLDAQMQYSCGYFTEEANSLDRAQQDKLEMICRKLRLRPGERLLDVGCGWGGLVCHAARHHGVSALGVTLSRAQLAHARDEVDRLGLGDRVEIELRDYETLTEAAVGRFDKIASIGMIEHVRIASHATYFRRLAALLRDRGLLLNHGITRGAKRSARRFRARRPERQLMLRHVFPGHELDHLGRTIQVMETEGFEIRDVEDWREHYALTTRHWSRRLSSASAEGERLVGRGRHRVWLAYLAGVSSAFSDGSLRVYQILASRHGAKGPSELPLTRSDLYGA